MNYSYALQLLPDETGHVRRITLPALYYTVGRGFGNPFDPVHRGLPV